MVGKNVVGCGQCIHCRSNRRREWVHRILLEMHQHEFNTFLTLTYDDEHVPKDFSLKPEHLTKFLKRLRKKTEYPIRYFAVGEYGDESQRPHYHLALFGHPNCHYGRTRPKPLCCNNCTKIKQIWGMGNVLLGELNNHSATYTAGYILKKLTNEEDERLNGRHPEFARMSRRPGIGSQVVNEISEALIKHNQKEVPFQLMHGTKMMPLDNYLRNEISKKTGLPKAKKTMENVSEMWQDPEIISLPSNQKALAIEHKIADKKRFKQQSLERHHNRKRRSKTL
jgi:hypothetical protein